MDDENDSFGRPSDYRWSDGSPVSQWTQEKSGGYKTVETFGVAVIGAGPGGYPAAIRAAQLGASVALVEKEELGGACLNWGCIPTKTLIASADLYAQLKSANSLGIQVEPPTVNYSSLMDRKDQVVLKLRGGIKQLLNVNGVKVFKGIASFEGRNRLTVHSEEEKEDIL